MTVNPAAGACGRVARNGRVRNGEGAEVVNPAAYGVARGMVELVTVSVPSLRIPPLSGPSADDPPVIVNPLIEAVTTPTQNTPLCPFASIESNSAPGLEYRRLH